MHDPRDEEPLTDASLDRAIEQALAVEPSPEFQARVRSRVVSETLSRKQYGWWAIGVAACATPVLLLALYVALPGRAEDSPDTHRLGGHADATVERAGDPAAGWEGVRRPVRDVPAVTASAPVRPPRPSHQAARETLQEPIAPHRWTIAMPEIVVSQAEVNAVSRLMETRVPEREVETRAAGEAVDGGVMALDVAELTISPLVIEPLELTARVQGDSE